MIKLRISTGKYKGINLQVPDSARPVTSRIKSVIFETLGERITDKKILDLFAGSGSMGIEALSRGASFVVFVDHNYESSELIKSNLKKLNAEKESQVIKMDYKIFLKKNSDKFNVIFLDPPFDFAEDTHLGFLADSLENEGIIVLRTPAKSKIRTPDNLKLLFSETQGESKIFYFERNINNIIERQE